MPVPREPGDPNRPFLTDEEQRLNADQRLRASMPNELPPRPSRRDEDDLYLQADPELAEGQAGFGRIALYAIAAMLIIGGVLYGMNQHSTNTNTASNPPAANTTAPNGAPATNTQPGTTTGTASPNMANPANPRAPGPGAGKQ